MFFSVSNAITNFQTILCTYHPIFLQPVVHMYVSYDDVDSSVKVTYPDFTHRCLHQKYTYRECVNKKE
jgi:hypothetical protein